MTATPIFDLARTTWPAREAIHRVMKEARA